MFSSRQGLELVIDRNLSKLAKFDRVFWSNLLAFHLLIDICENIDIEPIPGISAG